MITIEEIKKVCDIFEPLGSCEVELRNGPKALKVKFGKKETKKQAQQKEEYTRKVESPKKEIEIEKITATPEIYEVRSNFIGYFTRINPKTGETHVKMGDKVKEGDILGYVSVLGVLQEIKTEKEGKIKEILVEEGQPIEYGQPVMRIEVTKGGK
jgi:acetyl-CoA carboxylase biotin carboxyl carrier protein